MCMCGSVCVVLIIIIIIIIIIITIIIIIIMMMMILRSGEVQYTEATTCQPPPESNPEPATHEHCHIPQNYDTQENWLTDQHRNQRHTGRLQQRSR